MRLPVLPTGWCAPALLALATCLGLAAADDETVTPERPIHERIDLPSVAACGGCHLQVYREWSESLHAGAWTNANVRRATRDFTRKSCRACHSPLPVLTNGLDRRPLYRDFIQEDGVHCLSCHGRADGVASNRTLPDAPCRPVHDPRLQEARLCYPCHEPTHDAFTEYEQSDAFQLGITCADCHMPRREDGTGRSHGPHGGLNAEFVRRGLDWSAEVRGAELSVILRNRTGHRFPGEISSRSLLIEIEGTGSKDRTLVLRKPKRGEDREDDRLEPDEVRTLRFPLRPGVDRARVNVLFRPLPLAAKEQCFDLGEWVWERGS